ncbi:MAG: hypothetical protein M3Y55_10995 [Pseudomonadota bacterium]|nr:hypothetical protein [Pseudomonadota bacterium]
MDPFAAALDALFYAPGSDAAAYTPRNGLLYPALIRVIRSQPDAAVPFGRGQIIEGTNVFEIRKRDVALPESGARLVLTAGTFKLLGAPRLDVEGRTWTIGGTEAA